MAMTEPLFPHLQEQNPLILILRQMRNGVLICDASTKVLFFNPSLRDLLGLSEQSLYQPCGEIIHSEEFQKIIQHVLTNRLFFSEELILPCGTHSRSFQVDALPLTLPDEPNLSKDSPGCVVVLHDITAIKRTEKMRRDFVANVSHELRTPLSAIKGYAETLLDGALEDETVSREFVEVIHRHSMRLSRLVGDLLDLSKLEAPDFTPELKPISLKPIAERVRSLAAADAEAKRISFTIQLPETLPRILGNIGNVEQVLTNLVDNAIKYTPDSGKISLSAFECEDGMVQIDISDTGMGIEAKHIPRLFERFYRVDKARSRELGGTGLGLSIVKHIIQYHGGEIWVRSTPNKGSTFSFTLRRVE